MDNEPRAQRGEGDGERRGRHAKPPSEISVRWDRLLASALDPAHRRRLAGAGIGAVTAVLLVVVTVAGPPGGEGEKTTPVVAKKSLAAADATPMGEQADAPGEGDDTLTYLKGKDPDAKVTKHVTEVLRSGSFLRIYTDLHEEDDNSTPAVKLCEWTVEYLKEHAGEKEPIVFVHAKENDNGNVVLANKQSAKDDCKVGETR